MIDARLCEIAIVHYFCMLLQLAGLSFYFLQEHRIMWLDFLFHFLQEYRIMLLDFLSDYPQKCESILAPNLSFKKIYQNLKHYSIT